MNVALNSTQFKDTLSFILGTKYIMLHNFCLKTKHYEIWILLFFNNYKV